MRIAPKLQLANLLTALFVALVGAVGLYSSYAVERAFYDLKDHVSPTKEALEELRFAGMRVVASANEYALLRVKSLEQSPLADSRHVDEQIEAEQSQLERGFELIRLEV